jgi:hypothetical protein
MAAPAESLVKRESSPEKYQELASDPVILKAAELFGQGFSRTEIARMLMYHIDIHPERPKEAKLRYARAKLRKWEKTQEFRDLVWDRAVIELDMSTPQILRGVANKAKRGRVDAAKLALSITGRHRDRDEDRPGQINIQLGIMPRPAHQPAEAPADITVDYDEEDS